MFSSWSFYGQFHFIVPFLYNNIISSSLNRPITHSSWQWSNQVPDSGWHWIKESQSLGSLHRNCNESKLLDQATRQILQNSIVSTKAHIHVVKYHLLYIYIQKKTLYCAIMRCMYEILCCLYKNLQVFILVFTYEVC